MELISKIWAKVFPRHANIDDEELQRIEEMAKQERREEGAYSPDDVR